MNQDSAGRPDPIVDQLSNIDELLERQVIPNQEAIAANQRALSEALRNLQETGTLLPREYNAYPFSFSRNVPSSTPQTNPLEAEVPIPFDARIRRVVVIWPPGAENRVGVKFRTKAGERFLPRNKEEEYEAADDFGYPFRVQADVAARTTLVAEYINNDTENAHFMNVIAEIEQRGEEVDDGQG